MNDKTESVDRQPMNQWAEIIGQLFDKLVGMEPKHASPFEHVATPFIEREWVARRQACIELGMILSEIYDQEIAIEMSKAPLYCGNFMGWTQYRKMMKRENVREL